MTAHVAQLASSTGTNSADEASPLTRRSRWPLEVTAVVGPTVAVSRVNLAGKRGCLNPDLFGDPGTYLTLLFVLLAPKFLPELLQR